MQISIILSIFIAFISSQKTPPVWAPTFSISFVEGYTASQVKITGRMWLDRRDGSHDSFCGNVLPGVSTPCTQLIRDGKRYMVYPEKRQCCMCCDAAHGCGILKRDWLSEAKYLGTQSLIGTDFDKWSIPDGSALDYYWATTDSKQTPRKMMEVGSRIKDFIMNTYSEASIPDNVFALPSYCTSICPETTNCGLFRSKTLRKQIIGQI